MKRPNLFVASLAFSLAVGTFSAAAFAAPPKTAPDAADPTVGAPGPDCLELQMIDHTQILDDYTILFHMKGKTTYISKLPYRCNGLKFEDGFAYTTSINKICGNVDVIKVLRRGSSCALGPFRQYIAPAKGMKDGAAKM
ncbi:DUF6491 family protein [Govanella unica]|uniref:DUF6491 family protein n=1 Tax=Govanella unica TaxID=2975056 RepID=A0A9X3TZ31_9PROT|nr:DUF6491 family protein [Govania unica]MDA5194273.1 DUF6491 family protein [Govania unica]